MTVLTPKGSPMCTSMHTCAERMLSFLCLVATRLDLRPQGQPCLFSLLSGSVLS